RSRDLRYARAKPDGQRDLAREHRRNEELHENDGPDRGLQRGADPPAEDRAENPGYDGEGGRVHESRQSERNDRGGGRGAHGFDRSFRRTGFCSRSSSSSRRVTSGGSGPSSTRRTARSAARPSKKTSTNSRTRCLRTASRPTRGENANGCRSRSAWRTPLSTRRVRSVMTVE